MSMRGKRRRQELALQYICHKFIECSKISNAHSILFFCLAEKYRICTYEIYSRNGNYPFYGVAQSHLAISCDGMYAFSALMRARKRISNKFTLGLK